MDAGGEAVGGRRSAAHHLPLNRALSQLERKVCRLVAGAVARQGLAVDQWRVIDVLADDRGHPMSELAAAVMVPAPTLTKIVDKLVDAALVYRLVDDRDRRRVFAFLSEAGQELYTSLAPEVDASETKALAGLGDDQFVLRELLARMHNGGVWSRCGCE